jgi:hypothetical protein
VGSGCIRAAAAFWQAGPSSLARHGRRYAHQRPDCRCTPCPRTMRAVLADTLDGSR